MKIGVVALQGAVVEHLEAVKACGVESSLVRKPEDLDGLQGLIIPGGESTTISKLMSLNGLDAAIVDRARKGLAVYGTCAGLVLLAKEVINSAVPTLGLMNISVRRNSFGRQRESFEALVKVPILGEEPINAVFIRAPQIEKVGRDVDVLATYQDKIVAAREGRYLVSSFHPELTDDLRFHKLFLEMVVKA